MKKKIKIPPQALINPAAVRAKLMAEEEEKRINQIAEEIISILVKHSVKIREVGRILSAVDEKLGKIIREKLVEEVYDKNIQDN